MSKLLALFRLFRKGSEVADVEKWKSRQITANMLVALLASVVAVARAFGVAVDIADADLAAIAGGVFAAGNVIVTAVTSKRAGLPAPVQADRGPDFPAIDVPHAPSVDGPRGASSEG